MTRKRAHNVRVRLLTGRTHARTSRGKRSRAGSTALIRRTRTNPKHTNRVKEPRLRVDTDLAALIIGNRHILFNDRTFSLGDSVNHPRHGSAVVVGIEVRGSGGWDKIDYVLASKKGPTFRFRMMDAAARGLRAA
jgi:hypothetical protein